MSEIDLTDAKRRCADMASKPEGGHGRNLSENDRESIRIVLAELLGWEQSNLVWELDRKLAADISALLHKHYPDYEGPLVALIEKALADLRDANRRASEVPGLSATLDEVREERDAAQEARARTEKDAAEACARMRAQKAELRAEVETLWGAVHALLESATEQQGALDLAKADAAQLRSALDAWGHDGDCARVRSRIHSDQPGKAECDCNIAEALASGTGSDFLCELTEVRAERAAEVRRAVEETWETAAKLAETKSHGAGRLEVGYQGLAEDFRALAAAIRARGGED